MKAFFRLLLSPRRALSYYELSREISRCRDNMMRVTRVSEAMRIHDRIRETERRRTALVMKGLEE